MNHRIIHGMMVLLGSVMLSFSPVQNDLSSDTSVRFVDYDTSTELLLINQSEDAEVLPGDNVRFFVEAVGEKLTYQWYYRFRGTSDYTLWSGRTKASFDFSPSLQKNGMQVYCEITDGKGHKVSSQPVTLTVKAADQELKILSQTNDVAIVLGENVTFGVTAQGEQLNYQWYYKFKGESGFTLWSGRTKASFVYTPTMQKNGMQVYCEVRDGKGNKTASQPVTVTVREPEQKLTILSQTQDTVLVSGETVRFSVTAQGDMLSYQWYYKFKGESGFTKWNGRTKASFDFVPTIPKNGMQVYCEVRDGKGNLAVSQPITVTVTAPRQELKILSQNSDVTIILGESVHFSVTAQGDGLTYQWYYKLMGDSNFTKWSGRTKTEFTFTSAFYKSGMEVYCEVVDRYGESVCTHAVTISVLCLENDLYFLPSGKNECKVYSTDRKSMIEAVIPSSCNGMTVTAIGFEAFAECASLKKITLPASIICIEDRAFIDCSSLSELVYDGSESMWKKVSIGGSNEKLSKITIVYLKDDNIDDKGWVM